MRTQSETMQATSYVKINESYFKKTLLRSQASPVNANCCYGVNRSLVILQAYDVVFPSRKIAGGIIDQ